MADVTAEIRLEELTKVQLKQKLRELELPGTGLKSVLRERLRAALQKDPDGEDEDDEDEEGEMRGHIGDNENGNRRMAIPTRGWSARVETRGIDDRDDEEGIGRTMATPVLNRSHSDATP